MLLKEKARKLWLRLTEPVPSVQDPEERYQARLLASLFLVALPLGILISAVPSLIDPDKTVLGDEDFQVIMGSLLFWTVAYALSRTGHHRLVAGLSSGIASIVIFALVIIDLDFKDMNWLIHFQHNKTGMTVKSTLPTQNRDVEHIQRRRI